MLKILERRLTLQLLVFYCLFIVPLLLGGVELYLFQRDALQNSAQRGDLSLAQALALAVRSNLQTDSQQSSGPSAAQIAQFATHLRAVQQQLGSDNEVHIWIIDDTGKLLVSTEDVSVFTNLRDTLPDLSKILHRGAGNMIAREQGRDWLFSFVPAAGTHWTVLVQRPTDVTFAAVISFQNSLVIALVMLLFGATFFWFVMHGWVVAPLAKLARAVALIKPDQTEKVTESKLLAQERSRADEIGNLINAVSLMEDEIHSLFRASDQQSQARLRTLDAIMRSMDEGVLLERPDGEIIYANQVFTQFVGISPQELPPTVFDTGAMEKTLLALIEDPESYYEAIRQAEHGPYEAEFQMRGYYNRLGQLVPVQRDIRMRLFEVHDQAGQLIGRGKVFRDVTRRNEAERVKKNLLAIVSHELRTPLTSIKGYASSLLETDVELDNTLQEHFLRRIVEESDGMAELVTNLLEMSQLEAGTLKLYTTLHSLEALLEQAIPPDERCHLYMNLPSDLPLLYVDGRRIEMVLRNLAENARRYAGPDARVEIAARHERDHAQSGGGLYVDVADSGPGIPPDLTERIFDRFYQVDGGRQRSSSGVGLGLAICRGFIEAHGGRIWAENRSDGITTGAVFHIWLPPKLLRTYDADSSGQSAFELHNVL